MTKALEDLGWDSDWASAYEASALPPTGWPARVVRVDRGFCAARGAFGLQLASLPPGVDVTVGDWVGILHPAGGSATVAAVLSRRTAVLRGSAGRDSASQALAANIDTVAVLTSLPAPPRLNRIERLLAVAWESGAQPVVILTKTDLATPDEVEWTRDAVAAAAPGVRVLAESVATDDGLSELHGLPAPGESLVLLGTSGVGKSSLANALLGEPRLAVGGVRGVDGKGRHTTSHRELVVLPGGGILIDTPGLRGIGLSGADDSGVRAAFSDIEELATRCRFGDCTHRGEPGCAVLEAVSDGLLPDRRLDSWRKLEREHEWQASRSDKRLAAERKRQWKIVHKSVRSQIRPR